MFTYVTNARYVEEYTIWLAFDNGKEGKINLAKELDGEIFEPLKDIAYFKNFKIANDTLSWENGADFAPEFLCELIDQQNL